MQLLRRKSFPPTSFGTNIKIAGVIFTYFPLFEVCCLQRNQTDGGEEAEWYNGVRGQGDYDKCKNTIFPKKFRSAF